MYVSKQTKSTPELHFYSKVRSLSTHSTVKWAIGLLVRLTLERNRNNKLIFVIHNLPFTELIIRYSPIQLTVASSEAVPNVSPLG